MQVEPQLNCLICGFGDDNPFGTSDICECCGGEVRLDDGTGDAVHWYRTKWIEEGAKWFCPKERPDDWDLFEQLKQIPDAYR